MNDFVVGMVLLAGAGLTAVVFPVLFAKRYPQQPGWLILGIAVGLAAMFLWPFTLWAALAMWLTGFAQPQAKGTGPTGTLSPAPAGAGLRPAGRPGADAYLGGLLAQRGPAAVWTGALMKLRKRIVIPLCSLGALTTLVAIGLTAEPVPASTVPEAASAPTSTPRPSTATPPTSSSAAPSSSSPPPPPVITVIDVVDGDTVKLSDRRTVRIIGIDTPETVAPGKPVQCWGPEATAFATQTLLNKTVTVVADPTQDRVDSFGRTLAYVLLPGGRDFSVLAAEAGHARSYIYDRPPLHHAAITAAEAQARATGLGLWGPACAPPPPPPPPAPEPEPAFEPAPELAPAPAPDGGGGAYYGNCSAARSAGAAPLYAGDSGYRSSLDRDGDGVACET